ncbi:tetratricopeptide repeat protein, partial [Candidatus Frankia nodulisporulans]|uniref:tetratricopeptide repeat protein n=1 Tax=Candidatus Frankia nodulisporulans TaxID=2060052 RepID=UPI0015821858
QLGDLQSARTLNEDTLTRRRHTLGDNHPNTLNSASNLAANLRGLGEVEAAAALEAEFGLGGAAEDGF